MFSKETDAFCIRDVSQPLADKKHKRTAGKVCKSWTRNDLVELAISKLNISLGDDEFETNTSNTKLNEAIQKNKNISAQLKSKAQTSTDNMFLRRLLYFAIQKKDKVCLLIRQWFEENDLLIEDSFCGVKGKPKI